MWVILVSTSRIFNCEGGGATLEAIAVPYYDLCLYETNNNDNTI